VGKLYPILVISSLKVETATGFEPLNFRLRVDCATTVPPPSHRRANVAGNLAKVLDFYQNVLINFNLSDPFFCFSDFLLTFQAFRNFGARSF
jgi:hypothetical protein